jgi:excisionase family DNA binding protein
MGTLLTAHQVASLLALHVETVRRMARQGVLPSVKVGRLLRFREETVAAVITRAALPDRADTLQPA